MNMCSLIRAFACRLNIHSITVKLLTEYHLEFLHLKGGCTGSSESTHLRNKFDFLSVPEIMNTSVLMQSK